MIIKKENKFNKIIIILCVFLLIKASDLIIGRFNGGYGLSGIINGRYGFLLPFFIYFGVYLFVGFETLKKSIMNLIKGKILNEKFLMTVATLSAFALGIYTGLLSGVAEGFDEGCAIIIFYNLGEYFEDRAVIKSRESIKELMDIHPDFAVIEKDGKTLKLEPNLVKAGDIIVVKAGEKIPLDGKVIFGSADVDEKMINGESIPQSKNVGDEVISGTLNLNGLIKIRVEREYADSTVNKILQLVEHEEEKKGKAEVFIERFSKYYTPIVVVLSLIISFLPPLICAFLRLDCNLASWIYKGLNFLVVSCPCALVISVPLAFFVGISVCSKNGILVKGGIALENLNRVKTFAFDKTGTLTNGAFKVVKINPEERKEEILKTAYIAERNSIHPIAQAIKNAMKRNDTALEEYDILEVSGKGIVAKDKKNKIIVGSGKMMEENGIKYEAYKEDGTAVYVAKNGLFLGYIVIQDEIKEESFEIVEYLNKKNYKTVMLTGDNEKTARRVNEKLGLNEFAYSLLPQDKVEELEKLQNENAVCFVGDGINDAPVLVAADVGISMGGVGSDSAVEASDIVLMRDNLNDIIKAKKTAEYTMKTIYFNIIMAIGVKVLIMLFSTLGITGLWTAVVGDVGVLILAIINALKIPKRV